MLIETWAEPLGENVWRLDPSKGVKAVERGQDPTLLLEYLETREKQPLPETVLGFVKTCVKDGTAVKQKEAMVLFSFNDASVCELIIQHPQLQKLCKRCGENELVVLSTRTSEFRKKVNALGFGIV